VDEIAVIRQTDTGLRILGPFADETNEERTQVLVRSQVAELREEELIKVVGFQLANWSGDDAEEARVAMSVFYPTEWIGYVVPSSAEGPVRRRQVAERSDSADTVVIADIEDEALVRELENPRWAFRTVGGVASALGISRNVLEAFIEKHPHSVRWLPARDEDGDQLFAPASRPVSIRERLINLRGFVAKSTY
jgi:hypothetical protein